MKKYFFLILIFLASLSCSPPEKPYYRIVEMENNTFVIQHYVPSFGWLEEPFSLRYTSKEKACKKMVKLIREREEAIKSQTVKRILDCQETQEQ